MFEAFFGALQGKSKIDVPANFRAIVAIDGKFDNIYGPGEHWLKTKNRAVEYFDINQPRVSSDLLHEIFSEHEDIAKANFLEVQTRDDEVAIVESYDLILDIVPPGRRVIFWKDTGLLTLDVVSLADSIEIDKKLAKKLTVQGRANHLKTFAVQDGFVGLLTLDGTFDRQLSTGTYWFWNYLVHSDVKAIDMRWQNHEVNGQEVLTQDRVTVRVNINAAYRVVDPILATQSVKDFSLALHNAVQLAFRKMITNVTLDKLLSERAEMDKQTQGEVAKEMKAIGIEVGEISLKDVILPGEMRDILNQVVTAQKEAEANVIRRREETNATRSLLNTAKVMEDNPIMLRLKELEALELLASRIDHLTVHNGTQGLLQDLVKLRD